MGDFHFLRPLWLLALLPLGVIVWMTWRRQDTSRAWKRIVAPHLLPHLLSGRNKHNRFGPLPLLALGAAAGTLSLSGPAWQREPAPIAEDTAALAIVVKVTPSMLTEDIEPSRLARSIHKIHDLLALRPGARTALVAYSGTAHLVMPATTDGGIIDTFAQALDPKIMPAEGDAAAEALKIAASALGEHPGSILWITDGMEGGQMRALSEWRKVSPLSVRVLAALPEGGEFHDLKQAAQAVHADTSAFTTDNADVTRIARQAKFASVARPGGDRWRDAGYWLTPALALFMLPFFRPGWMVKTASRS